MRPLIRKNLSLKNSVFSWRNFVKYRFALYGFLGAKVRFSIISSSQSFSGVLGAYKWSMSMYFKPLFWSSTEVHMVYLSKCVPGMQPDTSVTYHTHRRVRRWVQIWECVYKIYKHILQGSHSSLGHWTNNTFHLAELKGWRMDFTHAGVPHMDIINRAKCTSGHN